jgi:hypothetical protein
MPGWGSIGYYHNGMDFSAEDLDDAIDRIVQQLLERAGCEEPPVDALMLAEVHCGQRIEYVEPDDVPQQYGDRPRPRFKPHTILLREDMTPQTMQLLAARACARILLPQVLQRLGLPGDALEKPARTQMANRLVPRLLLPTAWFGPAARKAGYDVLNLMELFPTAGPEAILARFLDVSDEPMVITVLDDGAVAGRRSNRMSPGRKLFPAEEKCRDLVAESGKPARARAEGWTAWGWPTPGVPFGRILVRASPDDIY